MKLQILARDGTLAELRDAVRGGAGDEGPAALGMAAAWGREDVIELLLDAGVDPDAQASGMAAVHRAVLSGQHRRGAELIALLVRRGADVDAPDDRGLTALAWAALRARPRLVEALLALGADPERADHEGKRPVDHARSRAYVDHCERVDMRPPPSRDFEAAEALLDAAAQARPR